jgi:hypothetical protein
MGITAAIGDTGITAATVHTGITVTGDTGITATIADTGRAVLIVDGAKHRRPHGYFSPLLGKLRHSVSIASQAEPNQTVTTSNEGGMASPDFQLQSSCFRDRPFLGENLRKLISRET